MARLIAIAAAFVVLGCGAAHGPIEIVTTAHNSPVCLLVGNGGLLVSDGTWVSPFFSRAKTANRGR